MGEAKKKKTIAGKLRQTPEEKTLENVTEKATTIHVSLHLLV